MQVKDRPVPESAVHGVWLRILLHRRSAANRYLAALIFAAVSLLLVELSESIDGTPHRSFAVLSVILSALYGGLGPALLDTFITAVAVDYLFSEPKLRVFDSWNSIFTVLVYLIIGSSISALMAALRASSEALYSQYKETELANKARDEILAIVSHDLRSPLSAILMNASLLERRIKEQNSPPHAEKQLSNILCSGRRMNRMIEDILDASKIQAGTFNLMPKRSEVGPIISEAFESTRSAAEEKAIQLSSDLSDASISLDCDSERITQVLTNLIGNAIKFSPHGSTVTVETERLDDTIQFSVQDEGPGISKDRLPFVFESRWQARETAHQGTGFGLFIAKSIVTSHGGQIRVESQTGRGARFIFTLPLTLSAALSNRAAA